MMDIKRLIYIFEYLEGMEPENIFPAKMNAHIRYVDQKLEQMGLIKKTIVETEEANTVISEVAVTYIAIELLGIIGYKGSSL